MNPPEEAPKMKKFYHLFIYRRLMKLTHRFGWHYMTRNYMLDPDYVIHRCEWCGARGQTWQDGKVPQSVLNELNGGPR